MNGSTTPTMMASMRDDLLLGLVVGCGSGLGPARFSFESLNLKRLAPARFPFESFNLKISRPFKIASVYVVNKSFGFACSARERFTFLLPTPERSDINTQLM